MKFAVQLWGVLNVIIPYYTYVSMCIYVDQFPLKCKLILVQGRLV